MRIPKKLLLVSICFVACVHARQHDFQSMLACHASSNEPGLAVRIEQSGELIFTDAIGIADIKSREPLKVEHVFQIGSVTKQFTAAAILQLSEHNKLSLQNTLGDFIPDIPTEYSMLTIESVLSHTSGLPNYNTDVRVRHHWGKFKPINEVIERVSQTPLLAEPGSAYSYSNTGYLLLGKVIEVASGLTYSEYLQQHIFSPLGMVNSFVITEGETTEKIVKGYTAAGINPSENRNPEVVDRSWIYAAGAVASTLKDMSRWHQGLISGKIISAENYQLMTTKTRLNNGETVNYGFGFDVYPISNQPSYSHQGQVPGFMAWSIYFPQSDLFATAFSNNDSVHPGPALLDLIARQLHLSPAPITNERNAERAKALIGKYQGADETVMTITFDNGQLYAKSGKGETRTLVLRENNSFSYECTEDYFELRDVLGKQQLVPVSIYSGEQTPLIRVEI